MTRLLIPLVLASGCISAPPTGIALAPEADTTVKFDFEHRPLPEIPLPNNLATRYDEVSATGRRLNASMVGPTALEERVRRLIDSLDGWGVLQPISIPFTGELDVQSILDAHRDPTYDTADDVVYLVDVTPDSPGYGSLHPFDMGMGNYPVILEDLDGYWKNDPRGWTQSLLFEEADEDLNGNGVLDAGEDSDADGVLDVPNYYPGMSPDRDDLTARADALMTFYERETDTLLLKPMVPLLERTTYAVVVTRRLKDANGNPVGSPFAWINHHAQTAELEPLLDVLPDGLAVDDIAFAFTYTTQSVESHMVAARDGIYGHGAQAHLAEEFPADVGGLHVMRDDDHFPDMINPYVVWEEDWQDVFLNIYETVIGKDLDSIEFDKLWTSSHYIDYQAMGWYESPQLFQRGPDGEWIPYDEQSWPPDLDITPVEARSEKVHFTVTVPRKEISLRAHGIPAPTVIIGHGYGGNRFNSIEMAGFFARFGLATISIDNVSHGIGASVEEETVARAALAAGGLGPYADASFTDRAHDLNNDGRVDSGGDFWSSYLFHTRDVVRQSLLDYMQLVRIMRSWDGTKRWNIDVDGDGENDIAGDFDGDGKVDLGGDSHYSMTGGSLGGMMSMMVGGYEPLVDVVVPIVGGGGLGDLGLRSKQPGVREAFILRPMGPLWVGTADLETGSMVLEHIVPDINDTPSTLHVATVEGVWPGDFVTAENGHNGVVACGYVDADGLVRMNLEADTGDAVVVRIHDGDAMLLGSTECETDTGAVVKTRVDRFEYDVTHQGDTTTAGTTLMSLHEGLGLRRANPELRRFQGLGQLIVDPGDMAVAAQHMLDSPLTYPGANETTGSHMFQITAVGDMNVPVSGGLTVGRAAGILDWQTPDPRFGVPANQVLLDTFVAEGVTTSKRYLNTAGQGILMDPDVVSGGDDFWGDTVPRLDPPLRAGVGVPDALGGESAFMFIFSNPFGQHGPNVPGAETEWRLEACEAACLDGEACGCADQSYFDGGVFWFNAVSRYIALEGAMVDLDPCMGTDDCEWMVPAPERREAPDLTEMGDDRQ